MDKTSTFIAADGAKIAYTVCGRGFPLVLAHGMGSNKEMWAQRKWVEILEKYFTVIALDLRGHGESDKSYDSAFYSVNNLMGDITGVVQECGFTEYHYFGHSYGATIGLQLCRHTKNIQKAVCAGTTFGNTFFKETVPEWIKEYAFWGAKKKSSSFDKAKLSTEELEWVESTDFDLILAQLRAWTEWNGVEVKDIRNPLAVYSGTKDSAPVLENLNAYKDALCVKGIPFQVFENLDHTGLVAEVETVSPWVLDFLLK